MDNLLKRIEKLNLVADIAGGINNTHVELLNDISSLITEIKLEFTQMRSMIDEQKYYIDKMKKLDEKLDDNLNRLEHIEDNFPDLPEEMKNISVDDVCQEQLRYESHVRQVTASHTPGNVPYPSQNGTVKKDISKLPEIRHITEQELNSLHGFKQIVT